MTPIFSHTKVRRSAHAANFDGGGNQLQHARSVSSLRASVCFVSWFQWTPVPRYDWKRWIGCVTDAFYVEVLKGLKGRVNRVRPGIGANWSCIITMHQPTPASLPTTIWPGTASQRFPIPPRVPIWQRSNVTCPSEWRQPAKDTAMGSWKKSKRLRRASWRMVRQRTTREPSIRRQVFGRIVPTLKVIIFKNFNCL